jgi:hypothetical protein
MSKKCPPGVICIENITIVFIIIFMTGTVLYINNKIRGIRISNETVVINNERARSIGLFSQPAFGVSNVENDVLLNPYQPPLRDDRVYRPSRGIPINISTTANDSVYRQVGILNRIGSIEMILPLMGNPLSVSRDKWNFYTMKDSNSMIKLPITFKGKSCTSEYGCDNLYNGDVVYVEGYNDTFKVTIYDNQVSRYIPY